MPTAYLYANCDPVAPSLLSEVIQSATHVVPTSVIVIASFAYIIFPVALTPDEKSFLDTAMAGYEAVFAATDVTPSTNIVMFGQSPDATYWKVLIDDTGALSSVEVE